MYSKPNPAWFQFPRKGISFSSLNISADNNFNLASIVIPDSYDKFAVFSILPKFVSPSKIIELFVQVGLLYKIASYPFPLKSTHVDVLFEWPFVVFFFCV